MKKLVLILLLLTSPVWSDTTYLHVTVDGVDTKTGADWAHAMGMEEWITHMTDTVVADTVYYVKEGTYTLSGAVIVARDGAATTLIKVIGVKSATSNEGAAVVASDYAATTARPLIAAAANETNFSGADYWEWYNIQLTSTSSYGLRCGTNTNVYNYKGTQSGAGTTRHALVLGTGCTAVQCELVSTGPGVQAAANVHLVGCYIHDCNVGVSLLGARVCMTNCIVDTCPTGVLLASYDSMLISNSSIYGCVTRALDATDSRFNLFVNNVISQCAIGAYWTSDELTNVWLNNLMNNTDNEDNASRSITGTNLLLDVGTQCMNAPAVGDFTLTYATAINAGLGITTNEGVAVALGRPSIGADQNDADLSDYTLTAGIVFPDAADVWYGTGDFGPTGAEYTPEMRASDIANCEAGNVKKDVEIDDVTGTYEGTGGSPFSAAWVGSNP